MAVHRHPTRLPPTQGFKLSTATPRRRLRPIPQEKHNAVHRHRCCTTCRLLPRQHPDTDLRNSRHQPLARAACKIAGGRA